MSEILHICTRCERHVKSGDCLCPFCGTKVACVPGAAAKAHPGISRSKLMALGAAGALSTAVMTSCIGVYGGPPPSGSSGVGGEGGEMATATGQDGAGGAGADAGKD